MASRPNILFSMCDDQRHDAMGCAGHPFLETPAMDRLAREGIRFRNEFTAIPLCAPSRASHLTGVYPHVHGVANNQTMPVEGLTTWPELLQRAGYRTGFIGKIHRGNLDEPLPGFDRWVAFRGQGHYVDPTLNVDGRRVAHRGHSTDLLAGYAVRFIAEADERPWALCLWYKAPHNPFTPPPRHADSYSDVALPRPAAFAASTAGKTPSIRAGKLFDGQAETLFKAGKTWDAFMRDYARTVRGVDDALARVLATLDDSRAAENTLVIHTSDHGHFFGEFGLWDKRWMYEASIRVPCLMRYPALTAGPGRVVDELVSSLDLPATIVDVAGLEVPDCYPGHSLRPLLTGSGDWLRQSVLIEHFEDAACPEIPATLCLRTASQKLIHYLREGEQDEFYDLAADPDERSNGIGDPACAADVARLRGLLDEAREQFQYVMPDLSRTYERAAV